MYKSWSKLQKESRHLNQNFQFECSTGLLQTHTSLPCWPSVWPWWRAVWGGPCSWGAGGRGPPGKGSPGGPGAPLSRSGVRVASLPAATGCGRSAGTSWWHCVCRDRRGASKVSDCHVYLLLPVKYVTLFSAHNEALCPWYICTV